MSRRLKWLCSGVAIGGIVLLLLGAFLSVAGARINTTHSIAPGLYWTSDKPVEKGDYVLFCPPPSEVFDMAKQRDYISSGFCPDGYGYMMKRILATKDDVVSIADEGVRVNGNLLPFSALIKADKSGQPLPQYRTAGFKLSDQQVMLMTDINPSSFDSRYFGPIDRSQIKTVIFPVITW